MELIIVTYTTSLTKDQKVERIKLENGDTVQILHVLEAYDTMQLPHQFLKKQFSNRAINSNHSIFKAPYRGRLKN